ncbi:regulator of G-protein signaling 18 [Alligator sinensis]|uniref:Regulator of G-protein signaling 18 n=1 Tax=Alligator sinensis TaxID=38654 RepID=A0A1U7S6Q1_ALLSI|nr:regulator of G-protein signaling 18 [Alligator sinensis]
MENPLVLVPQRNNSASKEKTYYNVIKSTNKEETNKETKTRVKEKRNRLSLLLQKTEFHENDHLDKPETLTQVSSVSPEDVVKWGESFDKLLSQKAGQEAFVRFLKTEFSEENIEFWIACENYKKSKDSRELLSQAKKIYEIFIRKEAPKEVNLDFHTKEITSQNIAHPTLSSFDAAQATVYRLMEQDSYPRFLRSAAYSDLLKGMHGNHPAPRRRSRSFTFNEFQDVQSDFTIWL